MLVPRAAAGKRQILSAIATGALAFLATAAVLHAVIRDPLHLHADARSEKLVMLQGWHGNMFSSVFGSSHVHDGFDPRAFDRTLANSPIATHTVNLAIEGGSQSEQRVMALQFVKQLQTPAQAGLPPQPCLVLLEVGAGANFTNDHLVHPRAINIYDWQTAHLVTHFVAPGMSRAQRVGRIGYALAGLGLHYANIGMLSNAIFSPPLDQRALADQTADDRRGQHVMPENPQVVPIIAQRIASEPTKLRLRPAIITPGHSELIAQLAAASPVPNLEFVYFEMPKADDGAGAQEFPDHLEVQTPGRTLQVPIINLARPDRFPQFYNASLWYDDAHLNGQGADLVSTVFAQQLKLWYAAHGMPHPCGG